MDGIDRVTGGVRELLHAVRAEGAGERVGAAAAALERDLGLAPTDDLSAPISRFFFSGHGHSDARMSVLGVDTLMDENGEFEDSAWNWIGELLAGGIYDDSDLRSGVLCFYVTGDREGLRKQAAAWASAHPDIVADKDLDLGILAERA